MTTQEPPLSHPVPAAAGRTTAPPGAREPSAWARVAAARRAPLLALAGVVALAVALRLGLLLSRFGRLDADEAATGIMARRISDGDLYAFFAGQDYMGALEQYGQALALALLPDSPTTLRLVQLVLAAATCALIYPLGVRVTGSRWAGVLAAALFAIGPYFNLAWGVKSRGAYASAQLLVVLALLLAFRLRASERRAVWWALAFGACAGVAIWQNPLTVYVVLPAALWALGSARGDLRRLLPAGVVGALAGAAPMIGDAIINGYSGLAGEPPPTTYAGRLDNLLQPVLGMQLGLRLPGTGAPVAGWLPPTVGVLTFAAAVGAGLWVRRRGIADLVTLRSAHRRPVDPLLVSLVVAVPLYGVSANAFYTGDPRYLFTLYPVMAVLAAAAVWRLQGRLRVAGGVALVALLALSTGLTARQIWRAGGEGGFSAGARVTSEAVDPAAAALRAAGVRSVYADYWLAYPLQFAAGDGVRVAAFTNSRFPALDAAVARDPAPAVAAMTGAGADQVRSALVARRVGFREVPAGAVTLFVGLAPRRSPAELGLGDAR